LIVEVGEEPVPIDAGLNGPVDAGVQGRTEVASEVGVEIEFD
jgi:hypothetical protein